MTTTTEKTKTNREQLPESVEKKMVKAIDDAFASESETFRAAAVIWSRKQLKFERGVRSSKPPIPAGLQHPTNRAKTQATLEKVAAAVGAHLDFTPSGSTTAAAPAATPQPEVTPDPKPSRRSSKKTAEEVAA